MIRDMQPSVAAGRCATFHKDEVGETLRSYASRYWELYNEIGGGNEKIAASTFRMGLLEDSELRESKLVLRIPQG